MLIVEDEPSLREALRYMLVREGFPSVAVATGEAALDEARRQVPALVVLDLTLPGMDGLEVCRALRRQGSVPILILTARQSEIEKIVGLELGADDYMTKPFSMRELLARIRALLRRAQVSDSAPARDRLTVGPLTVDRGLHRIIKEGVEISLTPKEFDLLAFLAENRGLVFRRETLLDRVWGYTYPGNG
ncbi:MAG: response regulator transcription factor, partial [Chloroflexi bacterium]|nr:response regulator transcription factor [Chloroflexota bacterium]